MTFLDDNGFSLISAILGLTIFEEAAARWFNKDDIRLFDVTLFSRPESIWFILGTGILSWNKDGAPENLLLKKTGVFSWTETGVESCGTGVFSDILFLSFFKMSRWYNKDDMLFLIGNSPCEASGIFVSNKKHEIQ